MHRRNRTTGPLRAQCAGARRCLEVNIVASRPLEERLSSASESIRGGGSAERCRFEPWRLERLAASGCVWQASGRRPDVWASGRHLVHIWFTSGHS
eukprot:7391973-Prymnesium_polylepis.3